MFLSFLWRINYQGCLRQNGFELSAAAHEWPSCQRDLGNRRYDLARHQRMNTVYPAVLMRLHRPHRLPCRACRGAAKPAAARSNGDARGLRANARTALFRPIAPSRPAGKTVDFRPFSHAEKGLAPASRTAASVTGRPESICSRPWAMAYAIGAQHDSSNIAGERGCIAPHV